MSNSTTSESYKARRADEITREEAEARQAAAADLAAEWRARNEAPAPEAAPAPTAPEEAPTAPEGEQGPSVWDHAGEALLGLARGPIKEGIDIFENVGNAASAAARPVVDALGLMTPEDLARVAAQEEAAGTLGEQADDVLGTPETLTGNLVEGMAGELAYLIPAARFASAARVSKAGKILATGGASAGVSGLLQAEDEGNLGNLIEEFTDEDSVLRAYSDAFAIEEDDSQLTRFLKNAGEDVAMTGVAEVFGGAIKGYRNYRKQAKMLKAEATAQGHLEDEALNGALDDMVDAKVKADTLDATPTYEGDADKLAVHIDIAGTQESLDSGFPATAAERSKKINEEGFRSRGLSNATLGGDDETFRKVVEGDVVHFFDPADYEIRYDDFVVVRDGAKPVHSATVARDGQPLSELRPQSANPAQAEVARRLGAGVEEAKSEAFAKLQATEAAVVDAALAANATPEALEAIRVTLRQNGLSTKKVDEALGRAVDENVARYGAAPEAPKRDSVVGNYLNVTADQADRITALSEADDIDEVLGFLGDEVFDNTNFERIAEDEDGVTNLVRAVGQITGAADESKRIKFEKSHGETSEGGQRMLAELAIERGTTPEAIVDALDETLPDMELDEALHALRTTELGLARKLQKLGAKRAQNPSGWTNSDRLEAKRYATLLANVSDRRSGFVSNIARTLQSLRIFASGEGYEGIMSGAREIRDLEIEELLDGSGDHIDRMLEMMSKSTDSLNVAKMAKLMTEGESSFMDIMHHMMLGNLLSGPATHALNITTAAGRTAYSVLERTAESTARAVYKGDLAEYGAVKAEMLGMAEGLVGALRLSREGDKLLSFEGSAYKSFMDGKPVTARDSTAGIGRLDTNVRMLTNSVPQYAARKAGKFGGRTREQKVASALNGSTLPAKGLRFALGALDLPFRSLAFGDELIKATSKHGRMSGQAYKAGLNSGLEGKELAEYVAKRLRDVNDIPSLKQETDLRDPAARERLNDALSLNKLGNSQAKVNTFTEEPGKFLAPLIKFKEEVPSGRWFVPFVNTPAQLINQSWRDMTVVGPGMDVMKGVKQRAAKRRIEELGDVVVANPEAADWMPGANGKPMTDEELAEASGRLALAAGLNLSMLGAVTSGRVTGSGPTNYEEREVGELSRTYSTIQIPGIDTPIKFDRFDPAALPLTVMADIYDLSGRIPEEEYETLIWEFMGRMYRAIEDRSWLSGMMRLSRVLEGGDRGQAEMTRWVVSTASNTFVPMSSFWNSIRKAEEVPEGYFDTSEGDRIPLAQARTIRQKGADDDSWTDDLMIHLGSSIGARMPAAIAEDFLGLWQKVFALRMETEQIPARDLFYNVKTYDPGIGPDMATPFQAGRMPGNDPVADELERLGFGFSVSKRFGTFDGMSLTPAQQTAYHKHFARPKGMTSFRERLESLMLDSDGNLSEKYREMSDDPAPGVTGMKRSRIKGIFADHMQNAHELMLANDTDVMARYLQAADDAGQALTPNGAAEIRKRRQNDTGSITDLLE
tara:strand:+ start:11178 stop:15719 length:4542 start_codon:yes stop_codon:yes gene_type:complete